MDILLLDRIREHLQPDEVPETSYVLVYQTLYPDLKGEHTYNGAIIFTNLGFLFESERKDFRDIHAYADITEVKNHSAFPAARIQISFKEGDPVHIRPINNLITNMILSELKNRV